jgi:hypothetical protein
MTIQDITLLSEALGTGLLLVAVRAIYLALKPANSGRTYHASLDTDYRDIRLGRR